MHKVVSWEGIRLTIFSRDNVVANVQQRQRKAHDRGSHRLKARRCNKRSMPAPQSVIYHTSEMAFVVLGVEKRASSSSHGRSASSAL